MEGSRLRLSLKERDRRWRRTREMMKSNGLDCLVVCGLYGRAQWDAYLTNCAGHGLVVVPLEGEGTYMPWNANHVVLHMLELERGATPWIDDWRPGATVPNMVSVIKEKGCEGGTIGIVGEAQGVSQPDGCIPWKFWARMHEALPNATIVEVSEQWLAMVIDRSEEEIGLIRESARIAELGCEAMLKVTRAGVSELDIYRAIYDIMLANLCFPQWPALIIQSGPANYCWGEPPWTFEPSEPRVTQRGDIVMTEIFSPYQGLELQAQMAVAVKPVDPLNQELADVARRTYEVGVESLRPGVRYGDVIEAMETVVKDAGCWHLTPLIHSLAPTYLGGKVQVGIENLPGIEKYKGFSVPPPVRGVDTTVRVGQVFELEPNAMRGKNRVNLGGAVLVTEKGAVELNSLPTRMRIVD